MIARRFLASLVVFLAGCAQLGNDGRGYPSLARRSYEQGGQAEPSAAPVVANESEGERARLRADVAGLVDGARAGAAAFDAGYGAAAGRVEAARGAAPSSEAWVVGQLAISALDSTRFSTVSGLASLDSLYADRMNAIAQGKAAGGAQDIDSARAGVLALVDSQNDRLDALKDALTAP